MIIKFPVRYNQEDECVEDADFNTILIPHVESGMTIEEKHERGEIAAEALNYSHEQAGGAVKVAGTVMEAPSPLVNDPRYTLQPNIKAKLNPNERKHFNRSERKVRKYVEKFTRKYSEVAA